jgi:REP-associated tyrosine transposase
MNSQAIDRTTLKHVMITLNRSERASARCPPSPPNSFGGAQSVRSRCAVGAHKNSRRIAMPFWRLYYHLVWATKNREQIILPEIEARLYAYIVRRAAEMDVYVYAINGWYDHVHLIATIPPKYAIATVIKRLKGPSAHEFNQLGENHFVWQRGYGVFSLGERQRPIAEAYVVNQKQHHQQQTTNVWLEHTAEYDEGPDVTNPAPHPNPVSLREQPTAYQPWGEAPF